jgi:ornithine cyclodeaminase
VRPIRRARVWSRNPDHAQAFASRESRRWGLPVKAVPLARDAVAGAHIVCTATSANAPVFLGTWLEPGMHLNAIGAAGPVQRELDSAAVARSRLFVDRRESALNEAEDLRVPRREGLIGDDHIRGEIGEVALGKVAGRTGNQEITLFKSLGLAVEDLAAAHHIYSRAVAQKLGMWVEFGGDRHGYTPA